MCRLVDFAVPPQRQSRNKRKHKDEQILEPWQRTKKAVEQESEGDTNCS